MEDSKNIYAKPLVFSIVALFVILCGSVAMVLLPLFHEDMNMKMEDSISYSALEFAGRDIYQREGCTQCHTQIVRPLKSEVLRYGDYTKPWEAAGERPFLWGSRRIGPDIARVGGKYSNEWHLQHLIDPQKFQAKSNMPRYTWLQKTPIDINAVERSMDTLGLVYTAEDITILSELNELDAVVAYMQHLGVGVEPLQLMPITNEDFVAKGNSAKNKQGAAERGKALYMSECSGCHGVNGEGNVGMPLAGYGVDMDEETAFMAVANGIPGNMPWFSNTMSFVQIDSIMEYLKTLTEPVNEDVEVKK